MKKSLVDRGVTHHSKIIKHRLGKAGILVIKDSGWIFAF